MKKLTKKTWMEHPWSKTGFVEEIDVNFLNMIKNPNATKETDDLNGEIKAQKIIFENIEKQGMRDPLLIVISLKHKTIRLEAGNHRIDEAKNKGYTHLPTATLIIQERYINKGNGTHSFDAKDIIDFEKLIPNPYPYQIKLSEILK